MDSGLRLEPAIGPAKGRSLWAGPGMTKLNIGPISLVTSLL